MARQDNLFVVSPEQVIKSSAL